MNIWIILTVSFGYTLGNVFLGYNVQSALETDTMFPFDALGIIYEARKCLVLRPPQFFNSFTTTKHYNLKLRIVLIISEWDKTLNIKHFASENPSVSRSFLSHAFSSYDHWPNAGSPRKKPVTRRTN